MEKDSWNSDSDGAVKQDEQAIGKVIDMFARGIRGLDADLVCSVFHPEANSFSVTPRGICIEPCDAWPKIIQQATTDKAHLFREQFSVEILSVEIVGTVAAAKVRWEFESAGIIDFYNLLKTDSGWLITNQVYHTFPRDKTS